MKIAEVTIICLTLLGIAYAGIWGLGAGLDRQEQFECIQWQSQAKTYQGFYLTKWQKEQCDHHRIAIEAPVQ